MTDIFKNLTKEELVNAEAWHLQFSTQEKGNASYIVSTLDSWINGGFREQKFGIDYGEEGKFFVLYAIGSTITDKPEPNDTDFLIATNHYISKFHLSPCISDLITVLKKDYKIDIDENIDSAYKTAPGSRVRFTLTPKKKNLKHVDIVFQYDVISEERWTNNDRYPSVPLFRFGSHNPEDERVWQGVGEPYKIKSPDIYLKKHSY